jgi:hypothetical protein
MTTWRRESISSPGGSKRCVLGPVLDREIWDPPKNPDFCIINQDSTGVGICPTRDFEDILQNLYNFQVFVGDEIALIVG